MEEKDLEHAVKSVLLFKAPAEDAPLEYGGHRIAEEPTKHGFFEVLAKFARFFGQRMIVAVAYIDPNNFQTSMGDGQDFGYEMLFIVLISLLIAVYLQFAMQPPVSVCVFSLSVFLSIPLPKSSQVQHSLKTETLPTCTASTIFFQAGTNQLLATIIAVAFLFSGIAAGIMSILAGQMVMEGAFQIKINSFVRRLITRCIAIIPALIVCALVGSEGLSNMLTTVNYILSIGLIFVLLPVVWYVTHDKYMGVPND
ncbi:hypothetical protein MMC19_001272 [Ptychographa xylographoides]|nr:hypothetical protein [Ptychographa xylographoides]